MERLLLIGEDIVLLTRLAAGLSGRFHQITVAHCEDVAARAREAPAANGLTLICLRDAALGLDLFRENTRLAFVTAATPEREALEAAGAQCFEPEADPARISTALAPRRQQSQVGRRPSAGLRARRRTLAASRPRRL